MLDLPPMYLAHTPWFVLVKRRSPKRRCKSFVVLCQAIAVDARADFAPLTKEDSLACVTVAVSATTRLPCASNAFVPSSVIAAGLVIPSLT